MLTLAEQKCRLLQRIKELKKRDKKIRDKKLKSETDSSFERMLSEQRIQRKKSSTSKTNDVLSVFQEIEREKSFDILKTKREASLNRKSIDLKAINQILYKKDDEQFQVVSSNASDDNSFDFWLSENKENDCKNMNRSLRLNEGKKLN